MIFKTLHLNEGRFYQFVTLAQAGAQFFKRSILFIQNWIPACAGMSD